MFFETTMYINSLPEPQKFCVYVVMLIILIGGLFYTSITE